MRLSPSSCEWPLLAPGLSEQQEGWGASYQPLQLQGEQGTEEEHNPDHWADDETKPEDARLCLSGSHVVCRDLLGTAIVAFRSFLCVTSPAVLKLAL